MYLFDTSTFVATLLSINTFFLEKSIKNLSSWYSSLGCLAEQMTKAQSGRRSFLQPVMKASAGASSLVCQGVSNVFLAWHLLCSRGLVMRAPIWGLLVGLHGRWLEGLAFSGKLPHKIRTWVPLWKPDVRECCFPWKGRSAWSTWFYSFKVATREFGYTLQNPGKEVLSEDFARKGGIESVGQVASCWWWCHLLSCLVGCSRLWTSYTKGRYIRRGNF